MNHKWLTDDAPSSEGTLEQILAVQTTNVTVTTISADNVTTEVIECYKSEEIVKCDDVEENKENSIKKFDAVEKLLSTPVSAKMVLEKALPKSLFPDAPTTPKVCRKMLYDDEEDLKEIVKKYQTNDSQQSPKLSSCCNSDNTGDCLLCHPKMKTNKPPSLELDKGIIC